MSAFTVHEPPITGGSKLERAESLRFVGEGFSWAAALFSPIYLILRGEWLALTLYIAGAIALSAALSLVGASEPWFAWMLILLNVVMGFELSEIKRWSLGRAGWQQIATVSGRGQEEAERRFFDLWLPTLPETSAGAGPWASSAADTVSRAETAVRGWAGTLRNKFVPKT